jgi:cytidylate kinase
VIAIDGPAGAGKTTTAREVARRLGFTHLDTGAMYRAAALEVLRRKGNLDDPESIARIVEECDLSVRFTREGQRVYLGGDDVTDQVRSPEVTKAVSPVCEVPEVRRRMVELQRKIAAGKNIVAEGRDIGTVVFPDADLKVFLTASLEERVRRRLQDYAEAGRSISEEEIAADLQRRDHRDVHRSDSPLKKADDAVEINTTGMSFPEQVEAVIELYRRKVSKNSAPSSAEPNQR